MQASAAGAPVARPPAPHHRAYGRAGPEGSQVVYTAPEPLIRSARCPVKLADLDAAWEAVTDAYLSEDRQRRRKAITVYAKATLLYDRWAVRHGPDPFVHFVRCVRADLIIGPHHWALARAFERLARRELLRLMIFMPPGHSKSLFASILLPAWMFGLNAAGRILAASHSASFVRDFGRQVRDMLGSPEYRRLFPATEVRADARAAHDWRTTRRGHYQAIGVGSAAAGRRADMLGVIDDPISQQDAYSDTGRRNVVQWYPSFRDRLMPRTPMVLMMTRWHVGDLSGAILKDARDNPHAEQWEVIKIPAILTKEAASLINAALPADDNSVAPVKEGDPPFPALWPAEEMLALRDTFPPAYWAALYMQDPTAEGGNIYNREWWRPWTAKRMPDITYLLQVWDTAYGDESELNDYNACTVWGLFEDPNDVKARPAIMLLGAYHERRSFPVLRNEAFDWWQRWDESSSGPVDQVIIEAKASGKSLIQELQRRGVPVMPWSPDRTTHGKEMGQIACAASASTMLYAGRVYYPAGKRWAQKVIEECAQLPFGEHDDLAATVTMALIWLRRTTGLVIQGEPGDRVDPPTADEIMAQRESVRPGRPEVEKFNGNGNGNGRRLAS